MSEGSYLFQDSFLAVNKKLLRYLEGDAVQAIIFTELASLSRAFKETDQMKHNDDWFFRSVEDLERDTCISYHKQKVAIEKLEQKHFIKTRIAGRPGKRYFKICHEVVESVLYNVVTIEEPKVVSKKEKQENYYKELNEAACLDFDTFKSKIDNMKKPFAVLIYTWGKMYQHYSGGKTWNWSPITLGKLRHWYNTKALPPDGSIDYSRLCEFFKDRLPINISDERYIDSWISYDKSNFEKPLEQRVCDPRGYWKWI